MPPLGLRARLVAGFVGIAALATLVAALLTSYSLHRSFDGYLEQRTADAGRSAVTLAEASHAGGGGRWTSEGLDLLSHELVLTGYDYRLTDGGRALLDTTKLDREGPEFRRVARLPVRAPDGARAATLELYALGPSGNMPADDELRGDLDRGHLLAAAIAAVVALGAGLVVAGRLARPLHRLAAAAPGIASGTRVPSAQTGGSREVRDLAQALDGLAEDLARQRRARRQLAQDLSHELRTPLMLLQSRIEAMQDDVIPFDAGGLATLHTETLRLGRLVGQIESLAEAEAQPTPLRRELVALHDLAREAHAAFVPKFELTGIVLDLDVSPCWAEANRDAVRQIAANLLTNALKYGPDGQPVNLSAGREDGMAVLRVSDHGKQIVGPERRLIFDRFHRGSGAAERSSGAGLGLTIARELAEAQRGTLELESGRDETSFALKLPAHTSRGGGETDLSSLVSGQRRPT